MKFILLKIVDEQMNQKNAINYTVLCQISWANQYLVLYLCPMVIQCQCISVHLKDVWVQAYNVYISKLLKIGALRKRTEVIYRDGKPASSWLDLK